MSENEIPEIGQPIASNDTPRLDPDPDPNPDPNPDAAVDAALSVQLKNQLPNISDDAGWRAIEERAAQEKQPIISAAVLSAAAVLLIALGGVAFIISRTGPVDSVEATGVGQDKPEKSIGNDQTTSTQSRPELREFTVPEGLWVTEMLPRIASQIDGVTEADLVEALDSGMIEPHYGLEDCEKRLSEQEIVIRYACWEGMLFPAKYEIEQDSSALEILAKMNAEFAKVTDKEGYGGAEQKHDMSAYEVIIIASLVEAEARTDADRPRIARVIYNRLQRNEPLGIDATYIYGAQDRQLQFTTEILESETPYGNRNWGQDGLPPTPIAAPGRSSLQAAMNPADGDWFFYVLADKAGNHAFAETIEEHAENVIKAKELGLLAQ